MTVRKTFPLAEKGSVTGKIAIGEKGYSTKSATGGGTPPSLG